MQRVVTTHRRLFWRATPAPTPWATLRRNVSLAVSDDEIRIAVDGQYGPSRDPRNDNSLFDYFMNRDLEVSLDILDDRSVLLSASDSRKQVRSMRIYPDGRVD